MSYSTRTEVIAKAECDRCGEDMEARAPDAARAIALISESGWRLQKHRKHENEALCPDCAAKEDAAKQEVADARKARDEAQAKLRALREAQGKPEAVT